jgi:hypothetical protein
MLHGAVILPSMRPLLQTVVIAGFLVGCVGQAEIKPAEVLDEQSGMTVGALQDPIEFVETSRNAAQVSGRRTSFAYLGPIEWDRMGEITYGLWIHVAPGNDTQVNDIHGRGAVTLQLDDGPVVLSLMDPPKLGHGPYQPIASWGQTAYFGVDAAMLKRMAASAKLSLDFRAGASVIDFLPSHETHDTLMQFARSRGITDD